MRLIMNNWRVYFSWWLAGGNFGLFLAIIMVDEVGLEQKLLCASFILIVLNLMLLLGIMVKKNQ